MPAPNATLFSQLAKMNFCAKQIKLPMDWEDKGEQYDDAFNASEKKVAPNSPTTLFREATLNKFHADAAKEMSQAFEKYIDGICSAISTGITQWLGQASITGAIVNGPVGMMTPGNVIGPPLAPLILSTAPKTSPQETKFSNAIANALGTAWQSWHSGLTGQLMYPAFAAFPGPIAPPTPNVPLPLIAYASPGEAALSPSTLKSAMEANLGDPQALHAADLFDAIATAFNSVFIIFKTSTQVKLVLGTGPIPTFAPPFVPVGPVVGGIGTGAPGCLM